MTEDQQRHARSFGGVADAYDRGRPTYPADAVAWLVGTEPVAVLELGAGTGKLTERLVALGHEVYATEPDEAMLEVLRRHLPDVPTSASGAEEIPLPDRSVDVVVAGQCFHWFDAERALPEIARVLKPGGVLAAVWNQRDARIPWVRKLGRIIGTQEDLTDPLAAVAASSDFGDVETGSFKHWQVVDRRSIQDLVRSRSNVAVLGDSERERTVADVLALYDDYGRGMDGMQLPYVTACYRAVVVDRPEPAPTPVPEPTVPITVSGSASGARAGDDPMTDSAHTLPRVAAGLTGLDDDAGVLLIDFR
ncbi:class I SAM-dependent methyltransferase [Nocardioides dongxiaopingii]|uniref:class I SAM-dependent methyltransferase n=1 Tax=Nocardioides dongxiaopingii TaxID=2576036 RepID=UPI0010C76815|nr:class I SAM-dependent methyltransferase [Nocardioides dongxiaopingii]